MKYSALITLFKCSEAEYDLVFSLLKLYFFSSSTFRGSYFVLFSFINFLFDWSAFKKSKSKLFLIVSKGLKRNKNVFFTELKSIRYSEIKPELISGSEKYNENF